MQRLDRLRKLVRPFVMKVRPNNACMRARCARITYSGHTWQIHPDKHQADPQAAQLNSSSLQVSTQRARTSASMTTH